jgi:mannose-6-phosphate isomerase-like protein (cupin superfamily)
MKAEVCKADPSKEYLTEERCFILEVANDDGDAAVSIARARVAPGVATVFHKLLDIEERYIIVAGEGVVEIGDLAPTKVVLGDVVRIPAGIRQRITNSGTTDLVFFCVCTPRFRAESYVLVAE